MRRSAWLSIVGALAAQVTIVQVAEAGQSDGVFIGVIRDASTGAGIEGAVVIVTAKIAGTAVVARLFTLTRPALMRLAWFASLYGRWTRWKEGLLARVRASKPWRVARVLRQRALRRWRAFRRGKGPG